MLDQELKAAIDALGAEHKSVVSDLKAKYDALRTEHTVLQTQVDAIDAKTQQRHVAGGSDPSSMTEFKRLIAEHKEAFDRHGRIHFDIPTLLESKSTILSTGLTSAEPAAGIQGAGRYGYRLRQLFRSVPTDLPTIGILRSTAETLAASPQVEGSGKSESTLSFELKQIPVQTIATYVNFSKQAMDDLDGFQEFIDSTLRWSLERKAEAEILSGAGTGVNLTGLMTEAQTFDTTILTAADGWNSIDILGAGAVQLAEAGWSPDFAVVSSRQWFRMVSLKDANGQYALSSPRSAMGERAYSLTVVPSDQMLGTGFLVGDSGKAVVRQRMQTTVEISREHGTNWVNNLCTALCEERFGLQILRPDAFVTGSLTTSPA